MTHSKGLKDETLFDEMTLAAAMLAISATASTDITI